MITYGLRWSQTLRGFEPDPAVQDLMSALQRTCEAQKPNGFVPKLGTPKLKWSFPISTGDFFWGKLSYHHLDPLVHHFFTKPNGYLGNNYTRFRHPHFMAVFIGNTMNFWADFGWGNPLHHEKNPSVMTSAVTVSVEVKVPVFSTLESWWILWILWIIRRPVAWPPWTLKFAHQLEIWRSSNHQAAAFLQLQPNN